MAHFTYQDVDRINLSQGDILNKTQEIESILSEVHPHYQKLDYKYFIVLTQSCDLVRREGDSCKSNYITLAAVRSFQTYLTKETISFKKSNFEKGRIFDSKYRDKVYNKVEKLFNNNEPEYFFISRDLSFGIEDDYVAFLKLSIAIKSELHYQACLNAKTAELRSEFKAKLGWLVGQMYSRVGTEDWAPNTLTQSDFRAKIEATLNSNIYWIDSDVGKVLKKNMAIAGLSEDEIIEIAQEIKPQTKKDQLLASLAKILSDSKLNIDPPITEKLLRRVKNDQTITGLLK